MPGGYSCQRMSQPALMSRDPVSTAQPARPSQREVASPFCRALFCKEKGTFGVPPLWLLGLFSCLLALFFFCQVICLSMSVPCFLPSDDGNSWRSRDNEPRRGFVAQ